MQQLHCFLPGSISDDCALLFSSPIPIAGMVCSPRDVDVLEVLRGDLVQLRENHHQRLVHATEPAGKVRGIGS